MNFSLDANKAKSAGNNRITTSGAYKGKILHAVQVVSSQKGTTGVEFTFESDSGATVRYLTVYTVKANGEVLVGERMIHAIMACCKIKNISLQQGGVKTWDGQEVDADVYPELAGQKIGLVLQLEQYETSGKIKDKFNIVTPFNYETEQTATEVLEGSTASQLSRIVESVKDKKLNTEAGSVGNENQADNIDPDDDIPF